MAMGWKLSPKSIAIVLAATLMALVPGVRPALADAHAAMAADSPREVVDLAEGWRFAFGDAGVAASQPDFDDSGWQEVSVPHSWNVIGEYALERSDRTNNAQGIGWYRLKVPGPDAARGMRQYLDFAAVGNIADVWVNGQHFGQHKGAFSRFRLDVTDAWKPGETNLIALRADNSKPAVGSSTEHVIPLAGDFFIHGGPYRPVTLVTANAVGIDLLDHGGPGIYVTTTKNEPQTYLLADKMGKGYDIHGEVEGNRASVSVKSRLRNSGAKRRKVSVSVRISRKLCDTCNPIVDLKSETRSIDIAPGGKAELDIPVTIEDAALWTSATRLSQRRRESGAKVQNPLYAATVEIRSKGRLLDSVTQSFGIRSFRFDADKGFFLNGEHLKLQGVSRHQDRLGKGWALSREDYAQDMDLIAEMGANSVRHAHYQHADAWSDEADKAGMVVWAELPYVGAPSLSGGKGSPELWVNAQQQLRELIRQNYNHPSIMMWSIGNEVDSAKAFGVMTEDPSPIDLLRRMHEVAKLEDPARPTTFADFSEDFGPFGKSRQPMTGVADLVAYNRYPGWYYMKGPGAGQALGGMMDAMHAKHPTVPIGVSEYGAGSGLGQFSDDPASGFVASAGRPQPEEYAAYVHEMLWPAIATRDYIHGSWVWNMFDFASDLRNEGDSVDINTKGLVSMDRKVKKDGFYYYKAAWTDAPMVHLTGKRYEKRSYPVMDVRAYSNAPSARLTFNGADLGEQPCINFTCVWKRVTLRHGSNDAVVFAGGQSDSAQWDGIDPAVNGVRIDAGNLAASQIGGRRYGSDAFVTGGTAVARFAGAIGGRGAPDVPVEAVTPALFDHWRAGEKFTYAIPVPDGDWTVTIRTLEPGAIEIDPLMAEMAGSDPSDKLPVLMSVAASGAKKIARLNVAQAAGGERKAIMRSFPVTVRGGMLSLDFAGVAGGKAVVAGIEITK